MNRKYWMCFAGKKPRRIMSVSGENRLPICKYKGQPRKRACSFLCWSSLVFCPGTRLALYKIQAHIVCNYRIPNRQIGSRARWVLVRGGRIPPLPVADEGGRRPNEAQSPAPCVLRWALGDNAELWNRDRGGPCLVVSSCQQKRLIRYSVTVCSS